MEIAQRLFDNLDRSLKYFGSPLLALLLLDVLDRTHPLLTALFPATPLSSQQDYWSPLAMLAVISYVVGMTIYWIHRNTIHLFLTRVLHHFASRKLEWTGNVNMDDASFARWDRRGAGLNEHSGRVQAVLDGGNTAAHFFYCTAWCIIVFWMASMSELVAIPLLPRVSSPLLSLIVWGVFVGMGLFADYTMTMLDLKAYDRFPDSRAGGPSPR